MFFGYLRGLIIEVAIIKMIPKHCLSYVEQFKQNKVTHIVLRRFDCT